MTGAGSAALPRRLGTIDAVVLGLGAMLGAGVFSAFSPAAQAGGSALLLGLVVAAVVAYCNAMSSARLAARFPTSGGAYVYGRERLGSFWGYAAGWSFLTGKTASAAAMALTVGHYAWPAHPVAVAASTVIAITALNYVGVQRSAFVTRIIVSVVLAVLAVIAAVAVFSSEADWANVTLLREVSVRAALESAGFLFFAFAGYARLATLGEEVRDPERVIPRAIRISLVLVLVTYATTALSLIAVLGASRLAAAPAPLAAVAEAVRQPWLSPFIRVAAVLAAVGALLALVLGISRTVLAMARDRNLPGVLDAVHARYGVPHRAEIAVGVVVTAVVLVADVRGAIGFSSFLVLVYYGIANASALTLDGRRGRLVPVTGLIGCAVVAAALPAAAVVAGLAVLAVGAVAWWFSRRRRRGPTRTTYVPA